MIAAIWMTIRVIITGALLGTAPAIGQMMPAPAHLEDIIALPGGNWLIGSAMAHGRPHGELYAIRASDGMAKALAVSTTAPSTSDCALPDMAHFAPHGIALAPQADGSMRLHVVNHGGREAVENFVLDLTEDGPAVRWIDCAVLPYGSGNAVTAMPGGGFAVSVMYDPAAPDGLARMQAGEPDGSVVEWTPGKGWRTLLSGIPGPNGIAVSPDGATLHIAVWPLGKVATVPLRGGPTRMVAVGFLPDNLRLSSDGTLLVTGQFGTPESVFACAAGTRACGQDVPILRINAATLTLLARCTIVTGAAFLPTAAVDVGDDIWVVSVLSDQIARIDRHACELQK